MEKDFSKPGKRGTTRYSSIHPGKLFLDTEGKRIQAHGGSIFYDKNEGIYYLYGENKEFTGPGSDIWTWGVRAYASFDFYNWKDMGLIIEPDENDDNSSLNPRTAKLDRPHIIYNELTQKYVCWCKIMRDDQTQTEIVLTADRFLGPYTIVKDRLRPLNMNAGDFDLAVAPDGKAYYYFERVHSETVIADLDRTYTDVNGYYTEHFPHSHPPYVREATAHFVRNYRHYIITSGTTGYLPNPSEVAVGDTWHGPFKVIGDPHPQDESHTSFHSQILSVFKVPGKKDLYIALADRWRPDLMDMAYPFYEEVFNRLFSEWIPQEDREKMVCGIAEKYGITKMQLTKMSDSSSNTRDADYIWLPLRFVDPCEEFPDGMVFIDWKDEWRIEDYE